jgi:two-component system CheB/CheR fusion protein
VGDERLLLIIFTEAPEDLSPGRGVKDLSTAKDRRIKKLEEDLATVRSEMQSFMLEQESFHEELQSANEEVVSSNEELQSVNEELETSKEEIEAANEELSTTNQELQTRNDLLNESYEYSEAILANMRDPMIILDKKMTIKSANNSFYTNYHIRRCGTIPVRPGKRAMGKSTSSRIT